MNDAHRPFRLLFAAAALAVAGAAPGCAQPPKAARLEVPAGALSFLAVGDWGRQGSLEQRRVARQMGIAAAALNAQFVLSLGDNFYPDGVTSVKDRQFFSSWENVYRDKSLLVDWYAALGNHDYHSNPQAEVEFSAVNRRWKMPARYYTVTKTVAPDVTAEFIIIDTSPFILEYHDRPWQYSVATADTVAQRRWLDSTLAASTAQWKFIVGHHHVYTGGERETQPELEAFLVPRMQKYGVTAYLCGHEHHLEHIVPGGSATHYFISGAGAETREVGGREGTRFKSNSTGFLAMSLTADSMVVQAVDRLGKVLYRTTIRR